MTDGARAAEILAALGGADNVVEIEGCITRLRTEVHDPSRVDQAALRRLSHGVVVSGLAVQVVVGPEADMIADDIADLL